MDGSTGAQTSSATEARKVAPYLFQGQTTSLCETCLALVPTIHPSAILRMEPDERDAALDAFVADLKVAAARHS